MIRATETQHHGDEFVERNAWLHLLIGLESYGRRFDDLLDAFAPADPARPPGEERAGDAQVVEFILGLASLRATLRRLLDEAGAQARRSAGRSRGAAGSSEWLR